MRQTLDLINYCKYWLGAVCVIFLGLKDNERTALHRPMRRKPNRPEDNLTAP